ncbi:uncharacterized protein LOC129778627 [Toxorhynchites rutilus septentrionalis]|uniref:uncharacterized protein LOC129778627 n=1 Tax=Toxorhynchites rutilus septentrionalis TaxID=329112 RepID=UPI002478C2C1|nr:uncharacterized protein LOC129778627 [Toxorhynchites rutilus septentrionalis]
MAELTNEIPSWITGEYFVDVASKKLQLSENQFKIVEIHVKPATETGDNYVAKLYRATVDVDCANGLSKKLSFVLKVQPQLSAADEFMQMMNVFPKETELYTKLIPGFEQLYHEKGSSVALAPKCWKHSTDPTEALVLDDLAEENFKMVDRLNGLDRGHAEVVLKRLAQFHAASAVYHHRHGNYSEMFREGIYVERSEAFFEKHAESQSQSIVSAMRTWPNGDFYADLMEDFGSSMFGELVKVSRANPEGFSVLNHGDAWCNNFMFQYGPENHIEEIMLVDFQMCIWTSPAIDLLYFLLTSVNFAIRLPQLDDMIHFYHQNLVEYLGVLEFPQKPPTLKELHLDLINRMLYGFSSSLTVLPICLMEKTQVASLDTLLSEDEAGRAFRKKMYCNPAFVEQMTQLMPFFYDRGVFDLRNSGYQTPSGVTSKSLKLPSFMRKDFFNDVVEKKLQLENVQYDIQRVWVELATKKGDNYGSTMYRAKIDVMNKNTNSVSTFSVIVKTRPTGEAANFSNNLDTFTKEIDMYRRIIPEFEKLYKAKGLNVEIGPRCLKICQGIPSDIIVMDDLTSLRYKLANRQEGLDQMQVEMVLEKLAQFHAASAVHSTNTGYLKLLYKTGLYNKDNLEVMERLLRPAYDACFDAIKSFPFAKEYITDLEKIQPVAFTRVFETLLVDPHGFNVLNHGDFWCNNILFQYEGVDKLIDSSLIDFQLCFYGSPVLDLNFFLFTSVSEDIRLSKLHYFIRYYHEKLISNLVVLGYRLALPTLKTLQFDFYDRLVYGASTIFGLLALSCVDPTDDLTMEALQKDDEAGQRLKKRLYTNERYVKALESLLPFFAKKGAFSHGAEECSAVISETS